jgi:hypothetical protein
MATKRKQPEQPSQAASSTTIQNCHITNTSAANEHTRAAVEALAAAAKSNAEAISAIANGLKGSPATMDYGIFIGSPK